MPIQRSYNLPSCTLQVEGISTEGGDRMSILTSFEYRFHHNGEKISGGRELLDSLINSAGKYAQSIQAASPVLIDGEFVSLEPIDSYIHKFRVKSSDASTPIELQLSTVQLFDLVESIDRLCLDPQTLLGLNATIAPVTGSTTRAVVSLLPAFIGVGSLAIASTILFLIPSPKPDPKPQPQPVSLVMPQSNLN